MKLSIFLSGACFGAVVGLVSGYLVVADELAARRQHVPQAQGHQHAQQADPHARRPQQMLPILIPKLDPAVLAKVEARIEEGGMEAIRPLLDEFGARITKDPKDYEAQVGLARLHIQINSWEKAARHMDQAVVARDSPANRLAAAQCWFRAEKYEEAASRLRALIKAEPELGAPYELLVMTLGRLKQMDELRAVIETALERVVDKEYRQKFAAMEAQLPPAGSGS